VQFRRIGAEGTSDDPHQELPSRSPVKGRRRYEQDDRRGIASHDHSMSAPWP